MSFSARQLGGLFYGVSPMNHKPDLRPVAEGDDINDDDEEALALLTRHEEEERGKHFEFSSSYRKAGETMTEFKLRNKRGIQ